MYPNGYFMPFNQMPIGRSMSIGRMLPKNRFNWNNLFNGFNKFLNVANQTIPLVRQVGPMVNNMKSVVRLASVFKDETDIPKKKNNSLNENYSTSNQNNYQNYNQQSYQTNYYENNYDNSPNFFLN